jgi:hypothetical protein
MLFRAIIAVYCEKYETHKNTMFKMQSTLLLKLVECSNDAYEPHDFALYSVIFLAACSLITCGELYWLRVLCFGLLYNAVNNWTCASNGKDLEDNGRCLLGAELSWKDWEKLHTFQSTKTSSPRLILEQDASRIHTRSIATSPLTRRIWLGELPLAAQKDSAVCGSLYLRDILCLLGLFRRYYVLCPTCVQQPSYLGMKLKGVFLLERKRMLKLVSIGINVGIPLTH